MNLKRSLTAVLTQIAENDLGWKCFKPVANAGVILYDSRKRHELKKNAKQNVGFHLFESLEVRNGAFRGMKYPSLTSHGSELFPKLLGSYELEIQGVVEKLLERNYTEIIDVGCAEGYYAVGLALRFKNAKVFAYDTQELAQEQCREMAKLNGVSDRVAVRAFFSPEELAKFPFTGRGLIVSDCEGFEKVLFNESNLKNIANADIIIEVHDFIDITISTYLKGLLSATHEIESVKSVDDIQKALTYQFDELREFSLDEKRRLLAEGRPTIMEWLVCTSKAQRE